MLKSMKKTGKGRRIVGKKSNKVEKRFNRLIETGRNEEKRLESSISRRINGFVRKSSNDRRRNPSEAEFERVGPLIERPRMLSDDESKELNEIVDCRISNTGYFISNAKTDFMQERRADDVAF